MATIIDKTNKVKSSLEVGDYVFTRDEGWGIVGYGDKEYGNRVYYLNGGFDCLKDVDIIKTVKNSDIQVTLE